MPIANYSTTIHAAQTVGEIQGMLAQHGAHSVMIEYRDREPASVGFVIEVRGAPVSFRLNANVDGVLAAMQRDQKVPRTARTAAQATRTAWRIVRDWLRAQLAMIDAEVVTLAQVMLPYAVTDSGATVYERLEASGPGLLRLTNGNQP